MATTIPASDLPVYVADAHPLLWHLARDRRLSQTARLKLEEIDANRSRLIIPAVVLAEVIMIVEKARLPISEAALSTSIVRWKAAPNVTLLPLLPDTVHAAMSLKAIPEIFDRLIVAEAQRLNAPLITRDPIITASKLVETIW